MIEEIALVKELKEGKAVVEVMRQSGCHSCQLNQSCGTGSLGRLLGFRAKPLLIDNEQQLKVGDRVVIGLPDQGYVLGALLVYLMPLILLMGFALGAQSVFALSDGWVALAGVFGLASGLWLAGRLSKLFFSQVLNPRSLRRVL